MQKEEMNIKKTFNFSDFFSLCRKLTHEKQTYFYISNHSRNGINLMCFYAEES